VEKMSFCPKCRTYASGNFCSSCGGKTVADSKPKENIVGNDMDFNAIEEARVNRHANASIDRAGGVKPGSPRYNDAWRVSLVNMPQDPGMPVSLKINDQTVYTSPGNSSNDVSAEITHQRERYGTYSFNLKIPVMGPQGNINKGFDTAEGLFVRFLFTQQGLEINQQSNPF